MHILKGRDLSQTRPCSYLNGEIERHEYFLASAVNGQELDQLWSTGHRKFGPYFFRQACEQCQACIPLRIPVQQFTPSKSQRRLLRKSAHVEFSLHPLEFRQDVFELYNCFIAWRFQRPPESEEDFRIGFATPVGASAMSLFFVEEKLMAVGFLDLGATSMSSVYFAFAPEFADYSPGTLGVLLEIHMAKQLGLQYYYLGYWVEKCPAMSYKANFRPYELMDAQSHEWILHR